MVSVTSTLNREREAQTFRNHHHFASSYTTQWKQQLLPLVYERVSCINGKFFKLSRAANSVVSGPIWLKFKLVRDFMHVLVTCKYKKDQIKNNEKRWRHHFPHYKSMRAFCCHGIQSFDPICPKILCSLSPTKVMLNIKFDQDGQLASEIFKFESVDINGRRTIGIL